MNIKPINCRDMSVMNKYKEFNFFATTEDYRNAIEKFKTENGRYPTVVDFDKTSYLPTARTIQRNFEGGISALRKLVGLPDEELDLRSGPQRSTLVPQLIAESIISENELYDLLITKFSTEKVHRQEPYTTKIKSLARSDFGIYLNGKHFYIDIFIPQNDISLIGCIGHKLRKFKKYNIQPDVYLVIGNMEMNEEWVNHYKQYKIQSLISRLPSHVKLVTYEHLISLINNNFVV